MPAALRRLAACLLVLAAAPVHGAAGWEVDAAASRFAVLTHTAGLARGLGHDHLIVARAPDVELELDPAEPGAAAVRFRVPVLALDVDPPASRAELAPPLVELGALAGDLPAIPDDDRAKIRRAMLDARQLFAERFPEIRAELSGLARAAADGPWTARLTVTLRGETVEKEVELDWSVDGETLEGELLAELAFTDFRIDPYSTLLGAIRNADRFHVYAKLVARRAPPTEG